MTELPEDSQTNSSHNQPASLVVDRAYIERLCELELELDKTRSEASAARLDARAADLELRIQRLGGRIDEPDALEPASTPDVTQVDPGTTSIYRLSLPRDRQVRSAEIFRRLSSRELRFDAAESRPATPTAVNAATPVGIENWDDVRRLIKKTSIGTRSGARAPSQRRTVGSRVLRCDPPVRGSAKSKKRKKRLPAIKDKQQPTRGVAKDIQLALDREPQRESQRRRKPSALLFSVIFHGLILVFLAFFTFSATTPGDQIAIAGSVADTDELQIESLEIETAEMQPAPSEPVPGETEYEISDIGEIAITEPITDVRPMLPSQLVDSIRQNQATSAASMSMKSDSDAKIKFCGVEGGGNHFVYLVDSSGSMGDAFESARRELLQSITALKPSQRFYVIFFDAESDYMRLSSSDQNEPRSAYATPQNKTALRRWAMTIGMDRGRAPYDALPFAIDLDPDVIFLLSDGEFPQKIEDLLKDINRVDNLFGDNGPISIVHTIGYHSHDGESRMKRIAKQNGGQYRYVPKP